MKNNYSVNFYKAYSLWKETLEEDQKYKGYQNSLSSKTNGDNSLRGVVGNKVIDLAWLEKIEETLPFMDEAIRESRSFIEQKDEIVPIQKVKRVNTQSIRHLAQHTNMIAKVEANGDVKPDRILNIYYESSSAIYENRFLYTLLGKLNDFVNKRYNDLRSKDERIDIEYDIDNSVRRKNKLSKMSLKFEYKMQADTRKVDLQEDVSNLSGFNRVVRIRRIISDFYALPLIKSLHGVEQVKPPIIQTNLLTKNVNFRTCMELWDYISRYRSNGYIYEDKEYEGKMPKRTSNDLSDVFIFTNFLTEITFNTDLKKHLEKNYKEQLKLENQEKKEQERLEKEKREEETKELIRIAVEKKTSPLHKKIEALENKNQRLKFKYEALRYKHKAMVHTANKVMKQQRLIETEEDNIRNLELSIMEMKEQINAKTSSISSARHSISQIAYPITRAQAEAEIKKQKQQKIKEQVIKFQKEKEEEIKAQILKFQKEKEEEIKAQILKFQQERAKQEEKGLKIKLDGMDEVNDINLDNLEGLKSFDLNEQENQEENIVSINNYNNKYDDEDDGYDDDYDYDDFDDDDDDELSFDENDNFDDDKEVELEKLEEEKTEEQKLKELIKRLEKLG